MNSILKIYKLSTNEVLQIAIIEKCRKFSDHFEFAYTPELTPELIKKLYFNFNW